MRTIRDGVDFYSVRQPEFFLNGLVPGRIASSGFILLFSLLNPPFDRQSPHYRIHKEARNRSPFSRRSPSDLFGLVRAAVNEKGHSLASPCGNSRH